MTKKVLSPQTFMQQTYAIIQGSNSVYCSNLIHYGSSPAFEKIVHDYENEIATTQKVCFKNREFHFAIYKYTIFKYFKDSLKKLDDGNYEVSLTFISPDLWSDPCEYAFYEHNKTINNDSYDIFCICTTLEPTEGEEVAWKRYERDNSTDKKTIRVGYRFEPFYKFLDKLAKESKEDISFYLSMADYSQSRDYFKKNLTKAYSSLDEYINDCSKKRKAFANENEMRIFLVKKNCFKKTANNTMELKTKMSPIDVKNLFHSFALPPYPPFPKSSPKCFYYGKIQDLDNFDLRIELKNLFDFDIIQSRLYETKPDTEYVKKLVAEYRQKNP